ncbi:MAG: penicillin-binding transpeptidase domain-containing protein [Patescibacteria group bacterium]
MSFWHRTKEYSVSVNHDDWVTPEETLVDAGSSFANIEQPISSSVFTVTGVLAVLCGLVILGGTAWSAVINYDEYADLAFRNTTIQFSVAPPRGVILDRGGKPLVKNVPSFDILAVSRELPRDSAVRESLIQELSDVLGIQVSDIHLSIEQNIQKSSVFFIATDIEKDAALALKRLNPNGIYVITSTKRQYLDGSQFSSIIGYTGRVGKADLSRDQYYLPSDIIGRSGIESAYEEYLRGSHGQILFSRDDSGQDVQEPSQGDTVVLNIDGYAQKSLYNAMFNVLRESGLGSAAGVVQDPRTGAVLAMASFPGFDNNIFSSAVSEAQFKKLFESRSRPLFNRVISGNYNPGSTIKPFIGMTVLQEKIATPSDAIQDCISISIPNPANPEDPYVFRNWRAETGLFNLRKAIANSCNIYFFTFAGGYGQVKGLGAEKLTRYLQKGLAGQILGIDLPGEESGFIPTPDWKLETKHEPWYQGDTYNISIGQGDLSVTPLWINSYIGAIANGGTIWSPRVAQRILNPDGSIKNTIESESARRLPFDASVISEMRRDMRETVLTGTAKILANLPVTSAAKSGTAEASGQTVNSLLTAFAPYENAEVAITVLVEGSVSNQGYASRIVYQFLNDYFTKTPAQSPQPAQ